MRLLSGTGDESKLNRYRLVSFAYTGTSLLGLFILASLAFSTSAYTATLAFRKQFTFLVFGAICILGAIAGIYPSKCSRVSYVGVHSDHASEEARKSAAEKVTVFKGHHPTCGNFSSHVLELRGKTYCAGCGGLIIGATASLFGALLFIVFGLNVGEAGRLAFGLGFMGVTCGLLQYNLPVNRGAFHFCLNSLFVLGAFLLLIGISEVDSIVLDLYFLTLVTYWIIARVMISRLNHRQTCAGCGLAECGYSFS